MQNFDEIPPLVAEESDKKNPRWQTVAIHVFDERP